MHKLYYNTTKRIAKKKIGKGWNKLMFGLTLKSGDFVSTCKGYNERIAKIEPCWTNYGLSTGQYIYDFDIETESGGSCSLRSCCTFPTESVDTIIKYWNYLNTEEGIEWQQQMKKNGWDTSRGSHIAEALKTGKKVFDEDGQPIFEYATEYKKKARFVD